jgi:putative FmdB family regulatory protein
VKEDFLMPIYEYRCTKCGSNTEVMQKFSDDQLTTCTCGGNLEKLISKSTFHLKGSGWYVTDYGSKEFQGKNKKTNTESHTPEKKSEPKTKDGEQK